jgi:hypothetical protein
MGVRHFDPRKLYFLWHVRLSVPFERTDDTL